MLAFGPTIAIKPMALFIAGTDTDIGKTIMSSWLCLHLQMDYWKPVQTGNIEGEDSKTVAALASCTTHPSCYNLQAPLSPHLAAQREGIAIDLLAIEPPHMQSNAATSLVIEGAGGVLTPLNSQHTILDLICHLQTIVPMPVLLVARSQLGTINHTCLTLEALRARSIPVMGVVLSGPLNSDNKEAIEYYGATQVLAELPWFTPLSTEALQAFPCPELLKRTVSEYTQRECIHA
jgi:dethiobiotin synthetase